MSTSNAIRLPISLLSIKTDSEMLEQGVEGGHIEGEAWRSAKEDADAVVDGGLGEVKFAVRNPCGSTKESAA